MKKRVEIEIRREGNTLIIIRTDTKQKLDAAPLDDVDEAKRIKRKWERYYNS